MIKHRDRRSGEEWEALSEHGTFRLGINYGFRFEFTKGRPLPREEYEWSLHNSPQWSYFQAPPYEEYLRLYDMYSETCKLRATGMSETDAAEAVRGRSDEEKRRIDQEKWYKDYQPPHLE